MTAAAPGATLRRVSATRGRIAGWGLALLFLANAGVVVALWLGGGGLQDIHDSASLLVGLGRISGLLGAYLVLVELLLLARLPLLERLLGLRAADALARVQRPRLPHAAREPRRARDLGLHDRRPHLAAVGDRAAVERLPRAWSPRPPGS